MLVIGSVLLAIVGIMIGGWGVTGFKNRAKWLEIANAYKERQQQICLKWFGLSLISLEFAMGLSMLTASVLLWLNLRAALVLGLWPVVFWLTILILPKRNRKGDLGNRASK